MKHSLCLAAGLALLAVMLCPASPAQPQPDMPGVKSPRCEPASSLPDLSGLTWLGGNRFLAVHDAKVQGEYNRPRVSLIELPTDGKGVLWHALTPNFRGLKSNDLESVARIPGTQEVLLVESGDGGDIPAFQRIFKARVAGNGVQIVATTQWPVPILNVEATAVASVGAGFVFLFAERAQGLPSSELRWALFDPHQMRFGAFSSVTFPNPNPAAYNRPIVALEVDSTGQIYIATAFDPEAAGLPDPDNGPFASAVYRIGRVAETAGVPAVELYDLPVLEGTIDGFKAESVAVREDDQHGLQIFVGFDDENYGATMRLLPKQP